MLWQKSYPEEESAPNEMTNSKRSSFENRQNIMSGKNKKWPPSPPSSPSIKRNTVETPKPRTVKTHLDSKTQNLQVEEEEEEEEEAVKPEPMTLKEGEDEHTKDSLSQARARLRRLNTGSPRTPHSPQRREL